MYDELDKEIIKLIREGIRSEEQQSVSQQLKQLITIEAAHQNLTCKITQRYNEISDMGHYCWVILNENGDILAASCSIAAPPSGKIDADSAKEKISTYLRWNDA